MADRAGGDCFGYYSNDRQGKNGNFRTLKAKEQQSVIYLIFDGRNPDLSVEERAHIEKNGLTSEKRDATECNILHKVLFNVFKLIDDNNVPGNLWIKSDNNKVLKYGNDKVLRSMKDKNQYKKHWLLNERKWVKHKIIRIFGLFLFPSRRKFYTCS